MWSCSRTGREGPLTSDQEQFLDAIDRNTRRLTGLADNLLTITSLESEATVPPHADVDLGDVIRASQNALDRAIATKELDVTFEMPTEPIIVRGDAASLESLVTNLMSNALKFTAAGGWVRCRLQALSGAARLTVSDNGLGIPAAEQRNLFTKFFRSSTAQEHAIQGSGLGLTIVDSIVHNHGGDISVVSAHLDGSTFTVNLPPAR